MNGKDMLEFVKLLQEALERVAPWGGDPYEPRDSAWDAIKDVLDRAEEVLTEESK